MPNISRQPLDHRPLTLLHVVGKLYCTVLATRLSAAAEQIEKALCDEQGGFRAGRCQSDQLYALLETIRTQRYRKRGLLALFVDIKKAYDRVHRNGLWVRLWQCGMRSKMWRVLRNLYDGVKSRIRINDADTDWFELAEGLRQGCVLSPLLYAVFINSLVEALKAASLAQRGDSESEDGTIHGVRLSELPEDQLLLLMFADDLVLVAESLADLQRMADILATHARQWRYEISLKKTKFMCFNKPEPGPSADDGSSRLADGAHQSELVWDGRQPIERASSYKYLGVLLTECLDWSEHKQQVYNRTADALEAVRRMGVRHIQPLQAGYVWTSLVRSCAEYATDVWGDLEDEWPELERLQVEMGRSVLRIDRASNHLFVLGELGWMRLATRRELSRLRYLWRLLTMTPTRWPARLFRITSGLDAGVMRNDDWFDQAPRRWVPGSWAATSLRLAAELGINADLVHLHRQYSATLAIEPEAERRQAQAALARIWDRCARTALERRDTLQWRDVIASDGRMTAFALLYSAGSAQVSFPCKRIWELEDYLRNEDAYARRQQTLLRYGGQQLRVSRGRWLKLPREQRLCQLCNEPGAVEDERHMVLHCPLYSVERERFRTQLRAYSVHAQWGALDLSEETLFGLAMGVRSTSMIHSSVKPWKVAMSY